MRQKNTMLPKIVPQEKVDKILEAVRLTATSSGLQPYEVLVVTNADIREKSNLLHGIRHRSQKALICWFSQHGIITQLNALT